MTGLLFGVVLSLLIVALLWLDVGFARRIEQQGIDWSMQLSLFMGIEPARGPTAPPSPTRLVFLDIDVPACERLAESASLCLTDRIGRIEVINRIGEALRGSGAALIVLDFGSPPTAPAPAARGSTARDPCGAAPGQDETARAFLATWACGEGPLVVVPVSVPPAAGRALSIDWRYVPGGAPAVGRLRYAAGGVWPPPDDGARIRGYPLAVAVNSYVADEPERTALPSIPFAAALYASRDRAQVDCVLYEHPAGCAPRPLQWNSIRFANPQDLGRAAGADAGQDAPAPRILYSFSSQVPRPGGGPRAFHGRFLGQFEHRFASAYIPARQVQITPGHLTGAIVVVGSSAAAAGDWHDTPLGPMTGAEIVANAIRAFEVYPPLTQPGLWTNLGVKILFVFLAFLAGWGAWAWVECRRSKYPTASLTWVNAGVETVKRALIFLIAMLAAIGIVAAECVVNLKFFPSSGQSIDIMFPIMAVFVQVFVDAAGSVIAFIRGLANKIRS